MTLTLRSTKPNQCIGGFMLIVLSMFNFVSHAQFQGYDSNRVYAIRDKLHNKVYQYKNKARKLNKWDFSHFPHFTKGISKHVSKKLNERILEIFIHDLNVNESKVHRIMKRGYKKEEVEDVEKNRDDYENRYTGRRKFEFSYAYKGIVCLETSADYTSYYTKEIYYFDLNTGGEYKIKDLFNQDSLINFEAALRRKANSLTLRWENVSPTARYKYLMQDNSETYDETVALNEFRLSKKCYLIFNKFSVSVVIPNVFERTYTGGRSDLVLRFTFEEINPYLNPKGPYRNMSLPPQKRTKLKNSNAPVSLDPNDFYDKKLSYELVQYWEMPFRTPLSFRKVTISSTEKLWPSDTSFRSDTFFYNPHGYLVGHGSNCHSYNSPITTYNYDQRNNLINEINKYSKRHYRYDINNNLLVDSADHGKEVTFYYYRNKMMLRERYDFGYYSFERFTQDSESDKEMQIGITDHYHKCFKSNKNTISCCTPQPYNDSLVYHYNDSGSLVKFEFFEPDTLGRGSVYLYQTLNIKNDKNGLPIRIHCLPSNLWYYIRYDY